MNQDIICENCNARNAISDLYCQTCGSILETRDLANDVTVVSEIRDPELINHPRMSTDPLLQVEQLKFWESLNLPPEVDSSSRSHGIPVLGRGLKGREMQKKWIIPLSILIIFIVVFALFLKNYVLFSSSHQSKPTPAPNESIGPDGIGVTLVNGEYIGISDGRYAFDTNRAAGSFMLQASESLRSGDLGPAFAEWDAAYEKDTSDAEPLIYEEDQRVLASGSPYITIVLGIALNVKVDDGFSRNVLQAAYILQKECNANPQLAGGKMLRLLIADSGSNPDHSKDIARQIVQAAQSDKTIIGVQGWTTSVTTLNALQTLVQAHLPIVASNNTSDKFTGLSSYYFRVVVPNALQTPVITTYIEKKFASQRMIVFQDPTEPYSFDAANQFIQQFAKDGYKPLDIEDFKTSDDVGLAPKVQKALETYKPDLVYIPSLAVSDVKTLLNNIPTNAGYANLKVFAGVSGYELVQSEEKVNGYTRMFISTSAFPDDWSILGSGKPQPPFFTDYPAAYDPYGQHIDSPYRYRRPTSTVMLTYDALTAFLVATKNMIQQGKQNPTSEDIKNALSQINGAQSFQGITGVVSFGTNGDPVDKVHFLLHVIDGGYTHVAAYRGCFLINSACDSTTVHILE